MADTRQSLFGPSPEEVAAAQSAQQQQDAMQWGNVDSLRTGAISGAMAGQAFGRLGGSLLGGQDPAQAKAAMLQQAQRDTEMRAQAMGINLATSPQDYYKVAADTLHKYGLVDEAQNVMNIAQGHDLAEREMRAKEAGNESSMLAAKAAYLKATNDKSSSKSILTLVPPGTDKKTGKGAETYNLSDPSQAEKAKQRMEEGYIDVSKLASPPNPGAIVNNYPPANRSWEQEFAGDQAKKASAEYDMAANAEFDAQAPKDILNLLEDPNMFVGPGASVNLAIGKLLNVAGANNDEVITNTQSLYSTLAKSTLDAIPGSNLGGGQGFTEADKKFLIDAAAGRIEQTRENIARIARLNLRSVNNRIIKWNSRVSRLTSDSKKALSVVGASTDLIPLIDIPPEKKYRTKEQIKDKVPAGIDPETWKYMPEDKKALFRK